VVSSPVSLSSSPLNHGMPVAVHGFYGCSNPYEDEFSRSWNIICSSFSGVNFLANLPPKVIMGDSVRMKISQADYEAGSSACQFNLHGHLTLHKGDSSLST